MLLGEMFERFVEQSPVTVMVRGILEKVLVPEKLDELFEFCSTWTEDATTGTHSRSTSMPRFYSQTSCPRQKLQVPPVT